MRLVSPRLFAVLAVVVIAWGGAHLLGSHSSAVTPGAWPLTEPSPSSPPAAVLPTARPTVAPAAPGATGAIPVLPGVMQQLNGSTRDTAIGLYTVIQQLEAALRDHLEQLARHLEPGP